MTLPIAESWFATESMGEGVTHIWEPHVDEFIRCNVWHVRGRDRDLLVDSGLGVASLREGLRYLFDRPGTDVWAVATHTHYDHIGSMHEFETRLVHPLEARELETGDVFVALRRSDFPPEVFAAYDAEGRGPGEDLLMALPYEGFDIGAYRIIGAAPTRLIDEGDFVDLGDRVFEVIHLPGHSPGGIGLWEKATGILFSGDAIYDGPLLDDLPGSSVPDYVRTMERLRELPVTVVHGGHDPSFGRERLVEIADAYLNSKRGEEK